MIARSLQKHEIQPPEVDDKSNQFLTDIILQIDTDHLIYFSKTNYNIYFS